MTLKSFLNDMYTTFILHAVISHFINGLLPVSVLFLALSLVTGDTYFEHTVLHLVVISSCTIPIAFISGIRDWRIKFHGERAPIFYKKIALSILLLLLSLLAVSLRIIYPDILAGNGGLKWLYLGGLVSMMPIVVLIGHFGGKLAYMARQMKR
jgi:uncharacterized membrane protein